MYSATKLIFTVEDRSVTQHLYISVKCKIKQLSQVKYTVQIKIINNGVNRAKHTASVAVLAVHRITWIMWLFVSVAVLHHISFFFFKTLVEMIRELTGVTACINCSHWHIVRAAPNTVFSFGWKLAVITFGFSSLVHAQTSSHLWKQFVNLEVIRHVCSFNFNNISTLCSTWQFIAIFGAALHVVPWKQYLCNLFLRLMWFFTHAVFCYFCSSKL